MGEIARTRADRAGPALMVAPPAGSCLTAPHGGDWTTFGACHGRRNGGSPTAARICKRAERRLAAGRRHRLTEIRRTACPRGRNESPLAPRCRRLTAAARPRRPLPRARGRGLSGVPADPSAPRPRVTAPRVTAPHVAAPRVAIPRVAARPPAFPSHGSPHVHSRGRVTPPGRERRPPAPERSPRAQAASAARKQRAASFAGGADNRNRERYIENA